MDKKFGKCFSCPKLAPPQILCHHHWIPQNSILKVSRLGSPFWNNYVHVLVWILFSNTKISKKRDGSFKLGKTWSFRFASIFWKICRVQWGTKNKEFKEKTKIFQNYEGSCNLGKTFWNPTKFLISSMEKKCQFRALLESCIGKLRVKKINIGKLIDFLRFSSTLPFPGCNSTSINILYA